MKIDKNIIIAALARDCEKSLPMMIELIEQLRLHFVWSHVVIVENDSKDNTKEVLKGWKKKSQNVEIISQDFGTITIPNESKGEPKPLVSFYRIEKMAMYRNLYMDFIKELEHSIDNVVIIDVDLQFFSIDKIINAIIECDGNNGAIFANGVTIKTLFGKIYSRLFYDVFAVYEYPLKEEFSFTEKTLFKTLKNVGNKVKQNKKYPVISAFGGVGIYNYNAISNLQYEALRNPLNKNEAICEHIPFNSQIVKLGYENFISRELEVIYGNHSFGSILRYHVDINFFKFLLKIYRFFSLK
jgi:hypothetical protein